MKTLTSTFKTLVTLTTSVLLPLCTVAQPHAPNVLTQDFHSDPKTTGWELTQFSRVHGPAKGAWVPPARPESPDTNAPRVGYVSIESGYWQSPVFAVRPHQYYRLTFQSKARIPGYWAAMFYGPDGKRLEADHNSGIFQTEDWVDNELYFQGKADAVTARLWFLPVSPKEGQTVCIRNITLATATDQQVLEWADRLYATLPPVQYQPTPDGCTLIPRAMQKLRNGEPLRTVVLGDSIGNDIGNAPLDKLIQRQYPGSHVTVITSVRGATGCQYYQQENRVREYVVRYKPDLVMMIAISHGHAAEPIRNVIRQIRDQCDAEILLTVAPITPEELMTEKCAIEHNLSIADAATARKIFLEAVTKVAHEERVEFLHLRKLWNDYLAAQEHDPTWFMRDNTHANVYGSQIVARMLEKYFAPVPASDSKTGKHTRKTPAGRP